MSDETIDNNLISDDSILYPNGAITDEGQTMSSVNDLQNDDTVDASSVRSVRFAPINEVSASSAQNSMDLLLDIDLELSVELGRASIPVRDVLNMGPGSIVELEKLAGEPVDILINGKYIAKGEVVVVDEHFGVRVTEISSRTERITRLA